MKFLLTLFAVLVVTAVVAHLALTEPGYVLLSYGKSSFELPLIDFIVAMLLLLLIGYTLIRFMQSLSRTPAGLKRMRHKQQKGKSRRTLMQGLIEYSEGKWDTAEKHLMGSADQSDAPLLNYIVAAHAAQRQRATDRRDDYLRMAIKHDPKAEVAISLAQAELQLRQGQHEESVATLQHLQEMAPKHRFVKKLLARQYKTLGDWEKLYALLPSLRKLGSLEPEEQTALELETFSVLLQQSDSLKDSDKLWNSVPKNLRDDHHLLALYCRKLMHFDASPKAETLLRKRINSEWDDELVALYGNLKVSNSTAVINQLDSWVEKHPENPVLLTAAGEQNMRSQLWGKARSLLQESLNQQPSAEAYQALGKLHEKLDEHDEARSAYHSGFDLLMAQKEAAE